MISSVVRAAFRHARPAAIEASRVARIANFEHPTSLATKMPTTRVTAINQARNIHDRRQLLSEISEGLTMAEHDPMRRNLLRGAAAAASFAAVTGAAAQSRSDTDPRE
jgi:hypothetical protein